MRIKYIIRQGILFIGIALAMVSVSMSIHLVYNSTREKAYQEGYNSKQEQQLDSPLDIQRKLKKAGHPLKIDGIMGPATMKAWDEEITSRHIAIIFDPNLTTVERRQKLGSEPIEDY